MNNEVPANVPTIVVVGSQPASLAAVSASLREEGFSVISCVPGEILSAISGSPKPDYILIDFPEDEPFDAKLVRSLASSHLGGHLPVGVITSGHDMGTVIGIIESGAVAHFGRPFKAALLKGELCSIISKKERTDDLSPRPDESVRDSGHGEGRIGRFFRFFLRRLHPYKLKAGAVSTLLVAPLAIETALPLGFKFITDDAILPHRLDNLVTIIVVLVIAYIILAALYAGFRRLYASLSTMVLNDIRMEMFQHLQGLSVGYFRTVQPGEITSLFSADLILLENTVLMYLPSGISEFLMVLFGLGLLVALEWKLAFLSLIGIYIGYRSEQYFEKRAVAAERDVKSHQSRITSQVQENVFSQPVVKMFRLQSRVTQEFKNSLVEGCRLEKRAFFMFYLSQLVPNQAIMFSGLITISAGAFMTYYGHITIGQLMAFQILLSAFISSVSLFISVVPHLIRASSAIERIERFLATAPGIVESVQSGPLSRPVRDITFDKVSFGYQSASLTLKELSFSIPVDRTILFVGPSGCGKSTVLSLIMRFYDPGVGAVLIDGRDLRNVQLDSIRKHMGVVFQDNFLFATTIRENIRLGRCGASDEEVEAAAKAAGIHEIIRAFPDGYDTIVGPTGVQLSGGQRQRIAIARALITDPAILLLDEATSALDPASAQAVNETLADLGKGRTVISVTHRLESAPNADLIFVFKGGSLVESGTHTELIENGSVYSDLWQKQTGFQISAGGTHVRIDPKRLRQIPILSSLDRNTIDDLANLFVTEQIQKDRWIVQAGDPGDRFYIIVRGRAVVVKADSAGMEQSVSVLEDGDYFGEIALVRNVPRVASIRAATSCLLLSLSGEHFLRLVSNFPQIQLEIEKAINSRMHSNEEK